ncbi:MAG: type 1 glutamine amidotransferase [Blastocatellia bacterium]|nr:type 1 glutamine amidotransferase [Blastocatellia bacterium]
MNRKTRSDLRILLIQPRLDLPMVEHELLSIARYSGLCKEQLLSVNPFKNRIDEVLLEKADAVIIGGSDTSVLDNFEWTESIASIVEKAVESYLPVFGSCWGHQMIVKIFGGKVATDISRKEIGSINVKLTSSGMKDRLFRSLPQTFVAQSGHKDHVFYLPECFEALADSELSPYQGIKMRGYPVYGAQFHADLGKSELIERLSYYRYDYVSCTEFDNVCANLRESPEALNILSSFVDCVVLDHLKSSV